MTERTQRIDALADAHILPAQELVALITDATPESDEYLFEQARKAREAVYGKAVYMRGLIEFTNYCKNDCYYCGIRRSAKDAQRYRLSEEQILSCCEAGYALGFRTFVLQGGEDGYYTDERIISIVSKIKEELSRPDAKVIATGGMGQIIQREAKFIDKFDQTLTLNGLRIIYEMNAKK